MSDDKLFERNARVWLELGPTTAPRRAVAAALASIEATQQERDFTVPWRLPQMTSRTRFALAAAFGVIAIVAAGAVLVQRPQAQVGNQSPTPPVASPSPSVLSLQDLQATWASVGTRNDPIGNHANPPLIEAMTIDQAGLRINSFKGDILSTVSIGKAGSELALQMEAPQGILTRQDWDCHTGDLGTYTWSLSDDRETLTLTSANDGCPTRAAILAGGWTRWSCPLGDAYAFCDHVSELVPGRYVSPIFKPFGGVSGQLAYTVPAGWAKLTQPPSWPDWGTASHVRFTRIDAPEDQAIDILSNVGTSAPCGSAPALHRTASEMADLLESRPYLSVSGRAPVTIGGLTGVRLDLSLVAASLDPCTDTTDIAIFQSVDDGEVIYLQPSDVARFVLLDNADGSVARSVVIEVSAPDQPTLDARLAVAMPVINSFEFIR